MVMKLMEGDLLKGYHLFMDRFIIILFILFYLINIFRYFCTVGLFKEIQMNGTYATGVIARNRFYLTEPDVEKVSKLSTGEFLFWNFKDEFNDLVLCCWKDSKPLFFISNKIGSGYKNEILSRSSSPKKNKLLNYYMMMKVTKVVVMKGL